jgi:predicted phage terminase large subunit-like protein
MKVDRAAIQRAVLPVLARDELLAFCMLMDSRFIPAAHVQLLVEHLEALERREIQKLMVFEPPRVGKSYLVSERFPAWYLGKHPEHSVIISSHSARLAERASRRVRSLLQSAEYPFTEVSIDSHLKAADRWETTKQGGVLAAGVGTGIVGFGADVLIIDDPVADRQHADSETERNTVWEWYTESASSRLMAGGVELLMHQRWHEDDLAGRLLNSEQSKDWTVLNLPALAELGDPMGRKVGEAIWPEKFDEAFYAKRKELIGGRAFAALYQQRPAAMEGTMFKRRWFDRRWDILPIHDFSDDGVRRASKWKVVQFVDTAFKTGVGSDYSVIATWATDGVDFYVLDIWRKQVEYPDLKRAIINAATVHKPRAIFIEDKASGQSVLQDLRVNTALPIVPFSVGGSKEGRADAVTPFFEAGKVLLPSMAPWLDDFIDEHIAFPNGAHDDMVDTTSMSLRELALKGSSSHAPLELVIARDAKRKKGDSTDPHWKMLRAR